MGKVKKFVKDWKNQRNYFVWLIHYSIPYLPKIVLMIMFGLVDTFLSVGLAVILKKIIDGASTGAIVVNALLIYVGLVLISRITNIISSLMSVMLNEKFSFGIRKQIYEKIIRSHWMEVKKYHTGDLLTRLTSDADIISDGIVDVIPTIIKLFVELLVTFFTLFYYEHSIAIFALLLAPVSGLVSFILGKKLKNVQIKVQESESNYRSFIQESFSNLLIVKAFANEEHSVDRLAELRNKRFYWVFKKNKLSVLSSAVLSLSFQLGYIGAFTIGSFQLARNVISFGTMSIFLTLVNRIQAPILALSNMVPRVVSVLASAGRIMEIQDIPSEKKSDVTIEPKHVGVCVENLSFGYSNDPVLENINFSIKPSEFVAVLGASGIGKTTLIRIIMSFISTADGSIRFWNEAGENELTSASIRQYVSYVPQGNTLFSGTIRDNILMGKLDASENEIEEAVQLSASASFINELPEGLDTVIGERGHGLSEGQAQRIAIARALIRKSPFLIFDEATSALDEKTELNVLEGIRRLNPKPTCLLITHRKSVLKYCNRELQIDNKVIREI